MWRPVTDTAEHQDDVDDNTESTQLPVSVTVTVATIPSILAFSFFFFVSEPRTKRVQLQGKLERRITKTEAFFCGLGG